MKLPEGKKCYNAGKISGLSTLGAAAKFAKFDKIIKEQLDMIPINPMVHGLSWSKPWLFHIVYDLLLLLHCDTVLFQPDWVDSRGARIENFVARLFMKEVYYFNPPTENDGKSEHHEEEENQ